MKAKKVFSMILAGAAAVSLLAGCGSSATESQGSTTAQATQTEAQTTSAAETTQAETEEASAGETTQAETQAATDETADAASDTSESGNVLVVYYSATGNTEEVANAIANATGGDLFELEPAQPYTSDDLDWTDENSRVSQEHADESLRDVELASTTVDNWDSYDTVFIGYPIWWGIAAWPVDTFVEANDFTGKTVIPFCTSSSSGLGESGSLLADLAGTGEWQEGMRFRSGVSEADVQDWVNELGL